MSKIIRNTLILTIITVVAGLGLGLVYGVTKEPIARTEEQAKKEAWQTVFSDVSLEDFKAVDVDKEAADKTVADPIDVPCKTISLLGLPLIILLIQLIISSLSCQPIPI